MGRKKRRSGYRRRRFSPTSQNLQGANTELRIRPQAGHECGVRQSGENLQDS